MKNINDIKIESTPKKEAGNSLLDGMHKETSYGRTENEALTFTRSGSLLLDFYAQAGAMRGNPEKAVELFTKAFAEDREKAIRILFYLRDVRGGQGERQLFRLCLQWLGEKYPDVFEQVIKHVPEYGRWDDLFFDNKKCLDTIQTQLKVDKGSKEPSLLAKWMPTINASSKTTRAKARVFANAFDIGEITYRKLIRSIRKKIKIVEEKMSAKQWGKINYSQVPSQASRIYKNAFKKHDEKRYDKFIDKAEKGEVKIQAGTLYPYQLYDSAQNDYSKTLEALWNQLPDYTQGKNALVVADTSASMMGRPMSVSISLALYFAERNKGQFKDHFITFSANPILQRIVGETLLDKMNSIHTGEVSNTNLQATFDLILNTAITNNTPKEEMPETIYIISDMEFDNAIGGGWGSTPDNTNFEVIKEKYEAAGYKKPNLVFWNVDARSGENLPVQKNEDGVSLVSGFSPVIFKIAVEDKNPEEIMLDTINSDRYKVIKLK